MKAGKKKPGPREYCDAVDADVADGDDAKTKCIKARWGDEAKEIEGLTIFEYQLRLEHMNASNKKYEVLWEKTENGFSLRIRTLPQKDRPLIISLESMDNEEKKSY